MPDPNPLVQKTLIEQGDTNTPEDVATLYSWANLHGAKYRDFSASRAQAREEARLRVEEALAAEKLRQEEEAERQRQEEAQLAARLAAEAAEAARQAEVERLAEIARQAEAERQAVLAAQEAQRHAAQQRAWQPPPEVFPSSPESDFLAGDQPQPYGHFGGAQEHSGAGSEFSPSFTQTFGPAYGQPGSQQFGQPQFADRTPDRNPERIQERIQERAPERNQDRTLDRTQDRAQDRSGTPQANPGNAPAPQRAAFPGNQPGPGTGRGSGYYAQEPAPASPGSLPQASSHPPQPGAGHSFQNPLYGHPSNAFPEYPAAQFSLPQHPAEPYSFQDEPFAPLPWQATEIREPREMREQAARPAWLAPEMPAARGPQPNANATPPQRGYPERNYQAPQPQAPAGAQPQIPMFAQSYGQSPIPAPGQNQGHGQNPGVVDDTLVGSRDRIANRWYALKSVFDPQAAPVEQAPAAPPARVPVLAVFSLAGGVGKTSLVASLGRALSSRGERVLLVDTAAYGLLPFFFGARDQRPGMLRTFNPPGVSADAPIQLVTLDPDGQAPEHAASVPNQPPGQEPNQPTSAAQNGDWLAQEVARYTRAANRVLIDLPTASGSTTRRVLRLGPTVLVPVLPDMNSVVSVGAIEAFFRHSGNSLNTGGKQIMPYYVLNQFDYSLPLHLDVREILREQIGDRLLPFALRRSPAVSEALAEGMTVMDYAPNAVVAEDYANLAGWVRNLSAPATQSYRGVRWSER